MKRYMQLIRAIMEYAETHGNGAGLAPPEVKGYTPDQVANHVILCEEAGYLEISPGPLIDRITWAGHEFLANPT